MTKTWAILSKDGSILMPLDKRAERVTNAFLRMNKFEIEKLVNT
jgi:hypothetical protein